MIEIINANVEDAKEILDIYAYYVKNTAITFEYDVPSLEEFKGRIKKTKKKYPYLIAKKDNKIVGYSYAGTFYDRRAYDHCVEVTIYIDKDCHKMGMGKKLYDELERQLKEQGIINLYACIAVPEIDDEYLNHNSEQFHEHIGYKRCGTFHKCGYKFNRWYDVIYMEKMINDHQIKQVQ